jgi:hypothetical protein
MRSTNENAPPLLRRVNLLWYPVLLVPILGALYLGLNGTLPAMTAVISFFLFCFWFFSLCFALYEKLRKRKPVDFRQ